MDYLDFLAKKSIRFDSHGFEPGTLNSNLFGYQREIVTYALRKGRAAMFVDTGLGKTLMQLEWANQVCMHTNKPVLILTPLAVAAQTVREAEKFGISAKVVREDADVTNGINVCNYERLDKLDVTRFVGVVLDESSILKSFMGKTKRMLVDAFCHTPYRLACTATPAPNDFMEIGNHSEFLGVMPSPEMLARWFINDTMNFGTYRIKGHAKSDFWDWVASWARCVSMPSDLGYSDDGFVLPELRTIRHVVDTDVSQNAGNQLFRAVEMSATSLHKEKKMTLQDRANVVASLVNASSLPWIVWCNTNDEADVINRMVPDAVEVRGSDKVDVKEARLAGFASGDFRVLVSKASIAGFGLNYQHCNRMAFIGVDYSYESYYQAVRRCWRFGQKQEVESHVVMAQTESAIWNTVLKKQMQHDDMKFSMRDAMLRASERGREIRVAYKPKTVTNLPTWITK